jgi:predicted Zn-dependent protease
MLSLAACRSAPVTGRSQLMLVSKDEEWQMRLMAYREILDREQPSHDEAVDALVEKGRAPDRGCGRTAAAHTWKAPHYRWEFEVIDRGTINAFCLPGGKIAVYTGILPDHRRRPGRRDRS